MHSSPTNNEFHDKNKPVECLLFNIHAGRHLGDNTLTCTIYFAIIIAKALLTTILPQLKLNIYMENKMTKKNLGYAVEREIFPMLSMYTFAYFALYLVFRAHHA